ncbi:MAG TPA: ACT domain-containing protein [Candidatus Nanoarchaeia archaeon]|nr:ACT domain-containing protein [Candidatus Nanoarchaeia archaeon]
MQYTNAFANIKDDNETTVIINQTKYNPSDVISIEKDFKIITFDDVLPFSLVGFLAKVSKSLAEESIPILAISSFSTDHILVKKKYFKKAIKKLGEIRFPAK